MSIDKSPSDYLRDKTWLIDRYCIHKLSCDAIAAEIGCDPTFVWRWLKTHDIPRRTAWETNTGAKRKPSKKLLCHLRRLAQANRGVIRSDTTRQKMSANAKAFLASHPEALAKLRQQAVMVPRGARSPHWKGGVSYTRRKSQLIKERGQHCQHPDCDWTLTLDVHHIDRNRRHNSDHNLLLLCPNHHSIAHMKDGVRSTKHVEHQSGPQVQHS